MIHKPYLIVYNCKNNPSFYMNESDFFQLVTEPQEQMDSALLKRVIDDCESETPVVFLDAQVQRPKYWQQRLLTTLNNKNIALCSALSTHLYELSPISSTDYFEGTVQQIDSILYRLQQACTFYSTAINEQCFVVRDKHTLSNLDNIDYYACNNLLVQSNLDANKVQGASHADIGNQHPLPAHALADLHWRLKPYLNQTVTQTLPTSYPLLDAKPIVLHIGMNWGGGVQKWMNDFCQHNKNYQHILLISSGEFYRHRQGENLTLYHNQTTGLLLRHHELQAPIPLFSCKSQEYKTVLNQIISEFQVKQIIVSSLIGHSIECLQTGIPTLRVLHDYFPSWPNLQANLESETLSVKDLDRALIQAESQPTGKISKQDYKKWRTKLHQSYQAKGLKLIAPSQSVIDNLTKIDATAFTKTAVIPHAITAIKPISYQNNIKAFQVLILGRINLGKGQVLLESLMDKLGENYIFILLGAGKVAKKYFKRRNIVVIMEYDNAEIHKALQEAQPDIAVIPSQTSETFNYTLLELQQAGICTISTKYGALKERVIDGKTGFLCDDNAEDMANLIRYLRENPDKIKTVRKHLNSLSHPSFNQVINQYNALMATHEKPEYKLIPCTFNRNIHAKNLQLLSNEKQRIDALLSLTENNLIEKTQWAIKLTKQNKFIEQAIGKERTEAKNTKQVLEQQISRVEEQTQYAEQQTKHAIKQYKRLETNALNEENRLKDIIGSINASYSTLHAEHQVALNAKRLVERELNEVYHSRSWRVTKPMRHFTTWARHKRNALKYRTAQLLTLPSRTLRSLKARGMISTLKVIGSKLGSTQQHATQNTIELTHNFKPLKFSSVKNPKVSVIIPVYNHFEHTYNCLRSLKKLQDTTGFEIIVVDDCSTDETQQLIKMISGIRYQRQNKNAGFIESCNTGAQLSKGQYLMFLNNDTLVHSNWLDALLEVFENNKDVGLVGSKLVYPNNKLQEAGGIIFSDASGWNYGRMGAPEDPWYNHVRAVDYCSGASILIPAKLFNQLGCFDKRYKPAYYEDTDLAFAVRETGKKVYYQPASVITHFEGISSGTDLTQGMKKYQVVNQDKFKKKWHRQLLNQPKSGSDIELCRLHGQPQRVLIFDACTPTPDQDAGSLRMLNVIKILKQLNYHVVFMPENLSFVDQYSQDLQQMGVECIYVPTITNPIHYLKEKGKYFSHIILSRYYVAEPVMPFIRGYCPQAQIIFDTVDLHYLRETRMATLKNDNKLLSLAQATRKKELAVINQCDVTLVVSPYEVEVLNKDAPEATVEILSTIHSVSGCRQSFSQRKDILFVGSYQHTPNVDAVKWFVAEIFPLILQAIPSIKFHIIGSKAPKSIQNLANENIIFHGFVDKIEPFFDEIRVAVAPLQYGAGVKGKINSSMSYGQPVVGTQCAIEGMYTQEGIDVLTADSPADFAKQVVRVYQDEALWNTLSAGGIKNVTDYFSFDSAHTSIQKLLK